MHSDGHTGIKNDEVKKGHSPLGNHILSYLRLGPERGQFVIHTHINAYPGRREANTLLRLGFQTFQDCPFSHGPCAYLVLAEIIGDLHFRESEVTSVHRRFESFCKDIGSIRDGINRVDDLLSGLDIEPWAGLKKPEPIRIDLTGAFPSWLGKYKPQKQIDHENLLKKEKDRASYWLLRDQLLFGKGDALEGAVRCVLEELGLSVEKTTDGDTVDLRATHPFDGRVIVFEITGTKIGLHKDNKKLAQVLAYLPRRASNEKVLLLANAYCDEDPATSNQKQVFSDEVVALLSANRIGMMTSRNLYSLWRDVIDGMLLPAQAVESLFAVEAVFTGLLEPASGRMAK